MSLELRKSKLKKLSFARVTDIHIFGQKGQISLVQGHTGLFIFRIGNCCYGKTHDDDDDDDDDGDDDDDDNDDAILTFAGKLAVKPV